MKSHAAVSSGRTTLAPSRDARLMPYSLIAFGALGVAFVSGQPALAALAVPFAIALALGLRRTGAIEVTARVSLDSDQVLEGDPVTGTIELAWDGDLDAEVVLHRLRVAVPVTDGSASWTLPAPGCAISFPIELYATHWGRHTVGEVWLRLHAPFGLLTWTGKVATGPALRVLPGSERLDRMLDPAESRAVLGVHRSRRIGDGDEFAELRPYAAGDRLRDLNRRASSRFGRPFVNRYHPELAGDVVIAIDAFADGSDGSTEALARAARIAWALASVHLRANDRVGVAGIGGSSQWLAPGGGRKARYQLLETLLGIGGDAAEWTTPRPGDASAAVPAAALVVALTPLHDRRTIRTLQAWRARGRSVAVIVLDTLDPRAGAASTAGTLARRLWAFELEHRRRELANLGISVFTVTEDGPIAPIISALRRARTAATVRRVN